MTLSYFKDISNIIEMVLPYVKRISINVAEMVKSFKFTKEANKGNIHSISSYPLDHIILEYESQTPFLTFI
jgi:hypothetical protein